MTYWAAPAKLKQPGMTADASIAPKSMPIIVALDLTLEQAAFPVMYLAVSAPDCPPLRIVSISAIKLSAIAAPLREIVSATEQWLPACCKDWES